MLIFINISLTVKFEACLKVYYKKKQEELNYFMNGKSFKKIEKFVKIINSSFYLSVRNYEDIYFKKIIVTD